MASPFDCILKKQSDARNTRLPFAELCGYYAALRDGVKPAVVARASGLSDATIVNLRHAGEHYGGQLRYQRVADEYRALGHEDFIHKYATPAIIEKLVAAETAPAKEKPFIGFNKRADKYARHFRFIDKLTGEEKGFTIRLELDTNRPGWGWRDDRQAANPNDPFPTRGDPRHQERLFATSKDAYDFAMLRIFPTMAQIDDDSAGIARDDTYWSSKYPKK